MARQQDQRETTDIAPMTIALEKMNMQDNGNGYIALCAIDFLTQSIGSGKTLPPRPISADRAIGN